MQKALRFGGTNVNVWGLLIYSSTLYILRSYVHSEDIRKGSNLNNIYSFLKRA